MAVESLSINLAEVMTSAMKKCLNLTRPNGAIKICHITLIISTLGVLKKTFTGLNIKATKKIIVNSTVGIFVLSGKSQ